MTLQCSTFWPIEDVGINGYCYGWVLNSRLVCVAGVLQVGSLGECVLSRLPSTPRRVLLKIVNVTHRARRSPFKRLSKREPPIHRGVFYGHTGDLGRMFIHTLKPDPPHSISAHGDGGAGLLTHVRIPTGPARVLGGTLISNPVGLVLSVLIS